MELKETALRLDGVMLRVAKDLKEPIYFIEVQSYKNADIYLNLLMKVAIYLKQNDSAQNWFGVVIYERRSLEPEKSESYEWLLNTGKILRIYLDEIDLAAERNLGIGPSQADRRKGKKCRILCQTANCSNTVRIDG
ncbi:MAG: DUF2887 domain-containing protein [Hormoscilla sp. GM7CHS1pb]|nr:DUF2887 domain-containing protein [Hormoscilla sp. GM7CHS1pb]